MVVHRWGWLMAERHGDGLMAGRAGLLATLTPSPRRSGRDGQSGGTVLGDRAFYDRRVAVGIKVGAGVDLLGDDAFVWAFFSTIAGHLEPDGWGTCFPTAMGALNEGELSAEQVALARDELRRIRRKLSRQPADSRYLDLADRARRPRGARTSPRPSPIWATTS